MDTLSFISSILSSIAWPLAVILITYFFRSSISNLFESVRLKRIKRGDFQIDFEQKLSEVRGKVEVASLPVAKPSKSPKKLVQPGAERFLIENDVMSIANVNPAAGIALAWSQVERELQSTIEKFKINVAYPYNSAVKNIQALYEQKIISQQVYEALNDLRTLRNKAVHAMYDTTLTITEAEDFAQVAENVVRVLSGLNRK
jgi:hypothetical protein